MSDRAMQADIGDATLDADVARWSADPGLAPVFAVPGGTMLVLDAAYEHVLRASAEAAVLAASIADAAGRIRAGLRLAEQVRSAGRPGGGARLVRIRFDARGIARPTSCLVARAVTAAGETVLLLAPTEPLPALRSAMPRAPVPTAPESIQEQASEPTPAPSGRLVWRSDGEGTLAQVAGAGADIAAQLTGRSWQSLADAGVIVAPDILAALAARQTFRSLPLVLRPPESGTEIEIELSGMPTARPAQPFTGFSGFGIVRGSRALATPMVAQPDEELSETGESEPAPSVAADDPPGLSSTIEAASADDAQPERAAAEETADEVSDAVEDTHEAHAQPTRDTDLSTHEHAAFREIARALGARFAGDDEPASPEPTHDTGRRGAVMAFPSSAAPSASTAIDAAIVSALDRLPAGVLVHREGETLYVNRRWLDLTGHPDREALRVSGLLAELLGRLPAHDDGITPETPVSVTTGQGELLALMVERSRVDWEGGPAELLMARAAAQADRTREQIARGLFAAREATRERDAQNLLDHIEEGVASLDDDGRVLALNESARAMLASDAREIVGGPLADLFVAEDGPGIAASLSEAREHGVGDAREVVLRGSHRSGPVRLRVARLSADSTARFCVTLREPSAQGAPEPRRIEPEALSRADFLARIGGEIRTPIVGIVAQAETMLAEQHGPLGSERYREELREIHHSGEHLLGVVEDLVDLARIEAGRGDLTFTDIALNDVVSACIALMQPQAARDRIVVRTSLSPDLKPLVADERSVRQAALNVIANAIRLTEAGGQVIVSTTIAERGEIAFRVRDTGIGMTQEEIERALAPFSRSEVAGGRNGTGLGLTLTKALVEANRGRFVITSRKNEGTLVEMLFPQPQALSA